MTLFGVLAVLVYRALADTPRRLALAFALTVGLAALDELHQHFVPLRHGRAVDVLIDTLGAALALAAYRLWSGRRVPD
jgi:VanZ family protein